MDVRSTFTMEAITLDDSVSYYSTTKHLKFEISTLNIYSPQFRPRCVDGCNLYKDVVQPAALNRHSLPLPVLPPMLTEASTALDRDPGIYRINYDLQTQMNTKMTTNNLTAFIFQVQTATSSHFYFKVSENSNLVEMYNRQ